MPRRIGYSPQHITIEWFVLAGIAFGFVYMVHSLTGIPCGMVPGALVAGLQAALGG